MSMEDDDFARILYCWLSGWPVCFEGKSCLLNKRNKYKTVLRNEEGGRR